MTKVVVMEFPNEEAILGQICPWTNDLVEVNPASSPERLL